MKISPKASAILPSVGMIGAFVLTTLWLISSTIDPVIAQAQVSKIFPDARQVGATREIHVNNEGKIKVDGLYVEMVTGSTLFTKLYWGDTFLRISVRTTDKTLFTKRYGTASRLADIQPQQYISAEGTIVSGSGTLDIDASSVKNWSAQTDEGTILSGTLMGVGTSSNTFILNSKENGQVTLKLTGTTEITKGARNISISDLKKGDTIFGARGTYHHSSRTLTAQAVQVYQDPEIFVSRLFIGTLKSLSGTSLPVNAIVTIQGVDYTVYLPTTASVLNTARQNVSLRRYVIGDTVRLSGKIRQTNLLEIDADVIRNISL